MSDTKPQSKGFFAIYKPGQGKWVRWGTVACAAIAALIGAIWLWVKEQHVGTLDVQWKVLVLAIWLALWAFGAFYFVNTPKYGEFMIMTESEMRKVSWPSRREVINSTKVVIILTLVLGLLLWLVDVGFIKLFQLVGVA